MTKASKYIIHESADTLLKTVRIELNRKTSEKKYNLSGSYPDSGGIDIFETITFINIGSHIGPMVKLNLFCVDTNLNGKQSELTLKRVNGRTYKLRVGFIALPSLIILVIATYYIIIGNDIGYQMLKFPIFGLVFILMIELWSELIIHMLKKRVEKLLSTEKIKFKKL